MILFPRERRLPAPGLDTRKVKPIANGSAARFDAVDVQIVQELQQDGRRPVREISKNLGIPEATVRLRLRKLLDAGVRIMAFANPAGFGQIKPALLLAVVEPNMHSQVVTALEEWDQVVYLSTMLGEFDLCIQVYTEDESELLKLTRAVRELSGVQSVKVMLEVDVHKLRWRLLRTPDLADD